MLAGGMLGGAGRGGGKVDGLLDATGFGGGRLAGAAACGAGIGAGGGRDWGLKAGGGTLGFGGLSGLDRGIEIPAFEGPHGTSGSPAPPGRRLSCFVSRQVSVVCGRARDREIVKLEEINRAHATLSGETKSALRIPVWFLGILLAGGVTFVAGFYIPGKEANAVLAQDMTRLAGEYKSSVAAYEKVQGELATAEKIRDEQKGALGEISDQKKRAENALGDLKSHLEGPLDKFVKAKALHIEKREGAAIISLEALYLVYPHKTFVHDRGKQLLCEIGKALPKDLDRPIDVVAHSHGGEPWSGILKKEFPSTFQLSASIASEVTRELSACGVSASDLRAVGAGHFKGDSKLARKSVARLEIVVYPNAP